MNGSLSGWMKSFRLCSFSSLRPQKTSIPFHHLDIFYPVLFRMASPRYFMNSLILAQCHRENTFSNILCVNKNEGERRRGAIKGRHFSRIPIFVEEVLSRLFPSVIQFDEFLIAFVIEKKKSLFVKNKNRYYFISSLISRINTKHCIDWKN